MLLPPDYEQRTIEEVRNFTDDIKECAEAKCSVVFQGAVPSVEWIFNVPSLLGRPTLTVQLVTESRKNPLAPGRLIKGDELRRHVRDSVDRYFKLAGHTLTRKAMKNVIL